MDEERGHARLLDRVLATLVVAYGVLVALLPGNETGFGPLILGVALSAGPVAVRSRWPLGSALVAAAGLGVGWWLAPGVDESFLSLLGPVLTAYTVGRACGVRTVLLVAAGNSAAVLGMAAVPGGPEPWDAVVMALAMLMSLAAGRASLQMQLETDVLRQHASALVLRSEEDVRAAAEAERLRIAREIHDVLGHTVSVMSIQAAAVRRRLLPEQQREREALQAVEDAGRESVAELRRLLGLLRTEPPGGAGALGSTARLVGLVEDVRRTGLDVTVTGAELVDELPAALATTVVRIVQEALTNVLRHAPAAQAVVNLAWVDGRLELRVEDNGPGVRAGESSGFGLVGMRERVGVFGGELVAGSRPGGGFGLRVTLPGSHP